MANDFNPYQAPEALLGLPLDAESERRPDLRRIAIYQKGLAVCLLIDFCFILLNVAFAARLVSIPFSAGLMLIGIFLLAHIVATILVVLLALKLYSLSEGIGLTFLTALPIFGMLAVAFVSGRATATLRRHGYKADFLGADLKQIPPN